MVLERRFKLYDLRLSLGYQFCIRYVCSLELMDDILSRLDNNNVELYASVRVCESVPWMFIRLENYGVYRIGRHIGNLSRYWFSVIGSENEDATLYSLGFRYLLSG